MAKIVIAGDAVVVTSSVKKSDLEKVEKYRPEALNLMGGEDNKDVVFKVSTTTGEKGSFGKYGVEFNSETHDDEQLATVTLPLKVTGADVRDQVAEKIGVAILNLNKVEAGIPAVLAEIDSEKQSILDNIAIVQ